MFKKHDKTGARPRTESTYVSDLFDPNYAHKLNTALVAKLHENVSQLPTDVINLMVQYADAAKIINYFHFAPILKSPQPPIPNVGDAMRHQIEAALKSGKYDEQVPGVELNTFPAIYEHIRRMTNAPELLTPPFVVAITSPLTEEANPRLMIYAYQLPHMFDENERDYKYFLLNTPLLVTMEANARVARDRERALVTAPLEAGREISGVRPAPTLEPEENTTPSLR